MGGSGRPPNPPLDGSGRPGKAGTPLDITRRHAEPARDLREDAHLAVGADRLQQGVLVDLAVDGDGHALLEVRAELRVALGELLEELLDGRRRELELGDAPRDPGEVTDQHDLHVAPRITPWRQP